MRRFACALVIALVCGSGWAFADSPGDSSSGSSGDASADESDGPDGRRSVAVLEYRSGSSALSNVGPRLAKILRKKTSLQVIDVEDARRQRGRDLDRKVAGCAGRARCIARIGKKLGAVEVLLIGVSRFGDEIITLQRIDVAERSVLTRIADALAQGAEPDNAALLGYLRQVLPKSDFLRYGTIVIESRMEGATVAVNGLIRGATPIEPLRVRAPAHYTIRISKAGYMPFDASVDVPPDGVVRVQTPLIQQRRDNPWYRRWWVLAIAGTAIAGTVTAVTLTRDAPNDLPVTIRF